MNFQLIFIAQFILVSNNKNELLACMHSKQLFLAQNLSSSQWLKGSVSLHLWFSQILEPSSPSLLIMETGKNRENMKDCQTIIGQTQKGCISFSVHYIGGLNELDIWQKLEVASTFSLLQLTLIWF